MGPPDGKLYTVEVDVRIVLALQADNDEEVEKMLKELTWDQLCAYAQKDTFKMMRNSSTCGGMTMDKIEACPFCKQPCHREIGGGECHWFECRCGYRSRRSHQPSVYGKQPPPIDALAAHNLVAGMARLFPQVVEKAGRLASLLRDAAEPCPCPDCKASSALLDEARALLTPEPEPGGEVGGE